jgi:hypothetical protein
MHHVCLIQSISARKATHIKLGTRSGSSQCQLHFGTKRVSIGWSGCEWLPSECKNAHFQAFPPLAPSGRLLCIRSYTVYVYGSGQPWLWVNHGANFLNPLWYLLEKTLQLLQRWKISLCESLTVIFYYGMFGILLYTRLYIPSCQREGEYALNLFAAIPFGSLITGTLQIFLLFFPALPLSKCRLYKKAFFNYCIALAM